MSSFLLFCLLAIAKRFQVEKYALPYRCTNESIGLLAKQRLIRLYQPIIAG